MQDTLNRFQSKENALELSRRQFEYWISPPIFEESKLFFALCPVPIYVVSNIDTNDINKALAFHDIKPAGVVTSEDAHTYKPKKEIFEFALRKFKLVSHEVIHIGDSITSDILGAKAAGINAIWINRFNKAIPDNVNVIVTNLLDVLKTRYLY